MKYTEFQISFQEEAEIQEALRISTSFPEGQRRQVFILQKALQKQSEGCKWNKILPLNLSPKRLAFWTLSMLWLKEIPE